MTDDYADRDPETLPPFFREFKLTCRKCGCDDIVWEDGRRMGSPETGMYGSLEIRCKKCGNQSEVYA